MGVLYNGMNVLYNKYNRMDADYKRTNHRVCCNKLFLRSGGGARVKNRILPHKDSECFLQGSSTCQQENVDKIQTEENEV